MDESDVLSGPQSGILWQALGKDTAVTVRIRVKEPAGLSNEGQSGSNAGQIGQRARTVTMDSVAKLSMPLSLGRGQIEFQLVLSRQQSITIEMKQMKGRKQTSKQCHE